MTRASRRPGVGQRRGSTGTVIGSAPDILIGAELLVVEIALLASAGGGSASELELLATAALQREMTDHDRPADAGMPCAAAELDAVLESRETVGFVIGIGIGETRVRPGRCGCCRRAHLGCRRGFRRRCCRDAPCRC